MGKRKDGGLSLAGIVLGLMVLLGLGWLIMDRGGRDGAEGGSDSAGSAPLASTGNFLADAYQDLKASWRRWRENRKAKRAGKNR